MKTVGVFYSPGIGGSWHIHNAQMSPGDNLRIIHFFVGDPQSDLLETVTTNELEHIFIPYRSRKDLLRAILHTRRILRLHRVDVAHGHGIEGTMTALIAGLLSGTTHRIHTRHHATMHHEGGPRRAVVVDRLVNRLSTTIIATCNNVRDCLVAREGVSPTKIRLLEYRLDVAGFGSVSDERIAAARSRHSLNPTRRVFGMVTRLVWWKGIEYGVEAFTRFIQDDPDAILVIAGAVGPHEPIVRSLLNRIPDRNYRLIEYELDIGALYHTFDVLIHLPVTAGVEAWGQVYIESMASRVPMVCTRSGIGNDMLVDTENCLIVGYRNSAETYDRLSLLTSDSVLRSSIVTNGAQTAMRYARSPDLNTLEVLYEPNL